MQHQAMGRIYDATWGRAFSALYDRVLKGTEDAGMRDKRREVLAQASGRTIDVGAGTGANLGLFPDGLTEVVMAEPDPHMTKQLRPKLAAEIRGSSWSKRAPSGCRSRTTASTPSSSRWCSARSRTRRRR